LIVGVAVGAGHFPAREEREEEVDRSALLRPGALASFEA
jgi:hypothetical protein